MEIARYVYDKLKSWKASPLRKPLMLLGARQVGKTYTLQRFGKQEYENLLYLNCHNNPFLSSLFVDFNIKRILKSLSLEYDVDILPGKTLIFFDEIQEIPQGVASLKYFCEDAPEHHVVVAGSLLGLTLRYGESFPVGKVNILRMYPLTFSEFLVGAGHARLAAAISTLDWNILNGLHVRMTDLLRQYYFTGGMPEAVVTYFTTNDVKLTRSVQESILDTYNSDIAKHTRTEAQRIHMVWDSIPTQLARENKKFKFSSINKGARAREFENALQWLVDAGLVYRIYRCTTPQMPLKFYRDLTAFKIYLLDCGLLAAMTKSTPKNILLGDHVFKEFKGAFTENYILQQLISLHELEVFYYSKDNSTQEVDFLVQTTERIIPIEVKAEDNVKSKSLSAFINNDYADQHLRGLRCSMKPYIDQGWMENIPLWAAEAFLTRESQA